MLPFRGMNLQQNMVNVSELLSNLSWMDNDHTVLHGIHALKLLLPWQKMWKQI
jgi:hypothetical protein